ncbi:hypothetical protein SLEP1_g20709 [Rubroshorea leprosula]|uniref:Conserved oligomeric Golgi complex subunit 5 N-terminal domain-containing protein n=1 Tax=Rubroshorea leprosula TaxID=152421 RepID=A0AAV5JCC3_9ROSI|nr:hypothetical protein SLEP1_g20709 [Rubroshorea leprosula]
MALPAAIQRSATPSTAFSPFPLQRLSTFKNPSSSPSPSSTTTTSSSLFDSFACDPILSPFLSTSFSSTSFSAAALSSGSPASTAEHLLQAIHLLDSQLRSHVLSHHPLLLGQLSSLKNAELSLSTLRSSVSSLPSSLHRIRSELSDPHKAVLSKTVQLSNLHRTSELLSHSIRSIRLSKKLRELTSSAEAEPEKLDLTKAAQLHSEILSLCDEYDLAGIDVVDEELNAVKEIGSR